MTSPNPSIPAWLRNSPRSRRALFVWTAVFITGLVIVAIVVAFHFLVGLDQCEDHPIPMPAQCTVGGRLLLNLALLAVVLPPAWKWGRYLTRILNHKNDIYTDE
jgi:hypothetical protein